MRAIFLAAAVCAAAALSGCASVDKSLFGGTGMSESAAEPSTAPPAPETADGDADQSGSATAANAAAEQTAQAEPGTPMPGTLPPAGGEPPPPPSTSPPASAPPPASEPAAAPEATAAPPPPPPAPTPSAPPPAASVRAPARAVAGAPAISPVVIAPGADTGTAVSHTIAGLRGSLQEIATRLSGAAQQYASLRASSAQQLGVYYQAQAQISARLQMGTTRGNPELVAQWNAGQAALDQLTANINGLGALATQIDGDVARARTLLGQIQSTVGVTGANDEDQRQLGVLEDEANQAVVVLQRLARDSSADLRRQTATLSNERGRLAQLAEAIKAGELYASGGARSSMAATAPAGVAMGGAGQPIVTIRFGRRTPDYQKTLYNALNQALQSTPNASFQVIAASPTGGSAAAVQAAQNSARRHAQEVMRTMGEMGVPAARMQVSALTDPSISTSEVRVVAR